MSIDSEQFISMYAEALSSFDVTKISSFCVLPTIIMSDQRKRIISTQTELLNTFSKMTDYFKIAGVEKFVPKLSQTIKLSDALFFSKLHWQFINGAGQTCFEYDTSYTMQKMPNDELKIIVMVIDDDKGSGAEIFNDE